MDSGREIEIRIGGVVYPVGFVTETPDGLVDNLAVTSQIADWATGYAANPDNMEYSFRKSSQMPTNDFKVGHAGATFTVLVHYSTGHRAAMSLDTRNEDMARWLAERFDAFQAVHRSASVTIPLSDPFGTISPGPARYYSAPDDRPERPIGPNDPGWPEHVLAQRGACGCPGCVEWRRVEAEDEVVARHRPSARGSLATAMDQAYGQPVPLAGEPLADYLIRLKDWSMPPDSDQFIIAAVEALNMTVGHRCGIILAGADCPVCTAIGRLRTYLAAHGVTTTYIDTALLWVADARYSKRGGARITLPKLGDPQTVEDEVVKSNTPVDGDDTELPQPNLSEATQLAAPQLEYVADRPEGGFIAGFLPTTPADRVDLHYDGSATITQVDGTVNRYPADTPEKITTPDTPAE